MRTSMSAMSATKPPIQPDFCYIIAKILALLGNMQVENSWGAIRLCEEALVPTKQSINT